MLEWLSKHWERIGLIVGLVLTVVSLYYGIMGWKRKRPTYLIRSNNIFDGAKHTIPDVEVKFANYGPPITCLTITKIALWNAGTETIKKQDVVKGDPIVIKGKQGVVFLSASVMESVSPLNNIECTVSKDRSQVSITFDYLDHNQGANIQVFHTGKANEDIAIAGTIMGASNWCRKTRVASQKPAPALWMGVTMLIVLWLVWGISWGLHASGLVDMDAPAKEPLLVPPTREEKLSFHLIGVIALVLSIFLAVVVFFTYIPKPFSNIESD